MQNDFIAQLRLQSSMTILTKKAIDASLKGSWEEAIEINSIILEKYPKNIDAKIRLGRAYLQLKNFKKAKRLFKEVLNVDPINQIALKNYKSASERRVERNQHEVISPKSLIKEPGATTEVELNISAKRLTSEDFTAGEPFLIKLERRTVSFFKIIKGEEILIGTLESGIVSKLNSAKSRGARISATFISGTDKRIKIMFKSSVPVFKAERQEVRPYIKKGSIEEPELELPELDD